MQAEDQICTNNHHVKFKSDSKISSLFKGHEEVYAGTENKTVLIFSSQNLKLKNVLQTNHFKKIAYIKQIQSNNTIITAGFDGLINIWDLKSNKSIHQFKKPGAQFTALDSTQHIMAAGYNDKIQFFDLKKMKHRGQFKQSFNGQISFIQFGLQKNTDMMTCSRDGMVNKFDLTQPNQQDGFQWGVRFHQCPIWLKFRGRQTLIRTEQHNLIRLYDQDQTGRINLSNLDHPKHILFSQLLDTIQAMYIARNPIQNVIESYINNKCIGYVSEVYDVQFLCPLGKNNQNILFCSEKGEFYCERLTENKKTKIINQNFNISEHLIKQKIEILNPLFASQKTQNNSNQEKTIKEKGYIVDKPSSFKNNKSKKFKPY